MFKNMKEKIKDLSFKAVKLSEETLVGASGQEKKAAAIEYILSKLPISIVLKKFIALILSKFIDEAVERAVEYMNEVKN